MEALEHITNRLEALERPNPKSGPLPAAVIEAGEGDIPLYLELAMAHLGDTHQKVASSALDVFSLLVRKYYGIM